MIPNTHSDVHSDTHSDVHSNTHSDVHSETMFKQSCYAIFFLIYLQYIKKCVANLFHIFHVKKFK